MPRRRNVYRRIAVSEITIDHPVRTDSRTTRIREPFSLRRSWVIAIIGLLVFSLELYEHINITELDALALIEFVIFISLLVSVVILTDRLSKIIKIQTRTAQILELKHRLSLQLASTQNWSELVREITSFPTSMVKPSYTTLLVFDAETNEFEVAGEFIPDELKESPRPNKETLQPCNTCVGAHQNHIHPVDTCELYKDNLQPVARNGYCLPLTTGAELVGVLQFQLPPGQSLTKQQVELFDNVRDEIGIALRTAQQQKQIVELNLTQAAIAERQEVFRDLHDVLGQNLAVLQMKLDQYSGRSDSQSIRLTDSELGSMRDIVAVSYQIVRDSLNDLHCSTTPYLSSLLNHQSGLAAVNSQFEYHFTETGEPRPLPPPIIHQTYFICKEAINNIAKHSGASIVEGKLTWGKKGPDDRNY